MQGGEEGTHGEGPFEADGQVDGDTEHAGGQGDDGGLEEGRTQGGAHFFNGGGLELLHAGHVGTQLSVNALGFFLAGAANLDAGVRGRGELLRGGFLGELHPLYVVFQLLVVELGVRGNHIGGGGTAHEVHTQSTFTAHEHGVGQTGKQDDRGTDHGVLAVFHEVKHLALEGSSGEGEFLEQTEVLGPEEEHSGDHHGTYQRCNDTHTRGHGKAFD